MVRPPSGVANFQLLVYLSDVTDDTHSFAVSPEPVGLPLLDSAGELDHAAQLATAGAQNLSGPAGTALLFNISRLHTVCVRQTTAERESLQAYFGHRHRPQEVAPHPGRRTCVIPPRLWRDHTDPVVREFCFGDDGAGDGGGGAASTTSKEITAVDLNQRSRRFAAAEQAALAAGGAAWSIEQALETEAALDADL
eukprot:SAG22_NODE_49_length_24620_cov_80.053587_21_plen_195_part_00